MKKYRFSRRWFFIHYLFGVRDMKMKTTPSCLPRRTDSENVLFDLERSISKSDLRSGQVRLRSDHNPSRSICISWSDHNPSRSICISCLPKRPDEPIRLVSFARLYLNPIASYWRKTDCDLM